MVRPEVATDAADIEAITKAAFSGKPYAAGDEHELIGALRSAGALTLSLVAVSAEQLLGQVTFSPATCNDPTADWFTLGPVAVAPAHQTQGIGAQLITTGLGVLSERGAAGCILTGNPDYYRRFGFQLAPQQAPDAATRPHFMIKSLGGKVPEGTLGFHPLFDT